MVRVNVAPSLGAAASIPTVDPPRFFALAQLIGKGRWGKKRARCAACERCKYYFKTGALLPLCSIWCCHWGRGFTLKSGAIIGFHAQREGAKRGQEDTQTSVPASWETCRAGNFSKKQLGLKKNKKKRVIFGCTRTKCGAAAKSLGTAPSRKIAKYGSRKALIACAKLNDVHIRIMLMGHMMRQSRGAQTHTRQLGGAALELCGQHLRLMAV